MPNQLSTTCISLLTQLLDLNSLEGLLDEERESYVLKNIQAELGHSDSKEVVFEDAVEKEDEQQEKKDKKFHKKLMKSSSKGNVRDRDCFAGFLQRLAGCFNANKTSCSFLQFGCSFLGHKPSHHHHHHLNAIVVHMSALAAFFHEIADLKFTFGLFPNFYFREKSVTGRRSVTFVNKTLENHLH